MKATVIPSALVPTDWLADGQCLARACGQGVRCDRPRFHHGAHWADRGTARSTWAPEGADDGFDG